MRVVFLIALAFVAAPLVAAAQETGVGRDFAASCAMCHGTGGRSVGGNAPIAGMAKDELERKLKEFRSGARPATIMHQIAKGYTDREVQLIAEHFAAQKK